MQSSIKYISQIEFSLNNVFIACNYISGSQNETLGVLGTVAARLQTFFLIMVLANITCHVMAVGFAAVGCDLLDLIRYSYESSTC